MEIIQASCGDIRGRLLHPPPPLLQFQLPLFTLRRFSYSFACSHHRRFRMLLPTSVLSLTPNLLPLISFSKPLTTAYSLPDGTNSGSATKAADVDPALAVKKKASEISPELKGTSIFLVGINNALKTSLGKLLADALRYYYFDSDDLVEEAAAGESAGKSFRETDKEGFCKSETEVLKQLSSLGRLVVCTGNGAVQSATNLALLRDGLSIWIDVPLDMVARDVVEKGNQLPPSDKNSSGSYSVVFNQLTLMFEEMRVGYATADVTVSLQKVASQLGYDDLDAVTKEDMALEVLKEIERLMRVKKMMEEAARPF
ncbi:probable inactive shikimate kinase like 1, chloroplastic isoform X1 [Actinidia eriantha]|uniref:probable inactive shikimate kinase like 1, chloroplastic isoform X1 n=1 Tax=Actinidia eriantha TaxID=165200 RepID=UPI00258A3FF3|nr:probable inactive shikimate kinase like 1, chloroplastic isoform X1 [Actinidia eriantha]